MVEPIQFPNDPRVQHRFAELNGIRYHYLYGEPQDGKWKETVFLIHGWPDLSAGWRFQIPLFLELGCRVVVPDMIGYGQTDAPSVPPNDLRLYSLKRAADDIAELAKQLGAETIVLGGHDWGGTVIWRTVLYHRKLVSKVFAVCTPYNIPDKAYRSTEEIVKILPQFGYQLHLASGEVEERIQSREDVRQFIKGIHGEWGPNKENLFSPAKGILFENLSKIKDEKLEPNASANIQAPGSTDALKIVDYYTDQYMIHGLQGPLNWYRTRKVNFEDELQIKNNRIDIPSLFIGASKDVVLKPEMAARMGQYFSNLTSDIVTATHWALVEAPDDVNTILKNWFNSHVVSDTKSSL